MDAILYLLLGHYLGDYGMQSDETAGNKRHSLIVLTRHVVTYTLSIAAVLVIYYLVESPANFAWEFISVSLLVIFIMHWVQDYSKIHLLPDTKQTYYFDQVMHIAILYLFRIVAVKNGYIS
jgi:hypothetical protein